MGHINFIRKSLSVIILLIIMEGDGIAAPIPSEVKSVVGFIFVEQAGKLVANGTGFFVGVKNPKETNRFSVYLVTAKHVLLVPGTTDMFDKIFLRLNRKDGRSEIARIPIITEGQGKTVFTHNDSSVDIVVIPALPDQEKFDFKFLSDDMITTKEDFTNLKIREGTDVFFTGLFTPYLGSEKNYPIVRFGRVALITEEKIEWKGQKTDLYLIEAGSYGGNSGSPVFFYLGSDREPGNLVVGSPILKLAGVMIGTFLDAKKIAIIETKKTSFSLSNMGIAAVVPAFKLNELLYYEELKKLRGF